MIKKKLHLSWKERQPVGVQMRKRGYTQENKHIYPGYTITDTHTYTEGK